MILKDQPSCFPKLVMAGVSSRSDGQMALGWSEPPEEVVDNRHRFLQASKIALEQTTLVKVRYGEDKSYDIIRRIKRSEPLSMVVDPEGWNDALVTDIPNLALFLPIADCVGTIFYDPVRQVIALAHLGRQSTVADLAKKLVEYLSATFQSNPSDLIVWMAPSIGASDYILQTVDFAIDNPDWQPFVNGTEIGFECDLTGYNRLALRRTGLSASNIHQSGVNTAHDLNYWSHFTQLSQHKQLPPRFAVVCMMLSK